MANPNAAIFPNALVTDNNLPPATDLYSSILTSGITAVATSIPVVAVPANFPCILTVDSEEILVTGAVGLNLTVLSRGFNGTTAASHNTSAAVYGNFTSYHLNQVYAEVKAIETALGSGFNVSQFSPNNWSLTPGGSLSIGSNTITLSPFPVGISSLSIGVHVLRISGGVGSSENVTITGVNTGSNTITFTCVNTHSGAWAIGTATGGIQEAIIQIGVANGQINLPAGNIPVYATITMPITGASGTLGNISIVGRGMSVTQIRRDASFTSGDIFYYNNALGIAAITIRDMDIISSAANITSGAAIRFLNSSAQSHTLLNLKIMDGYKGVTLDHSGSVNALNVRYFNEASYNALGGTQALCGFETIGVSSGNVIAACGATSNDFTTATMSHGLYIHGCDGLQVLGCQFTAFNGITLDPTTNQVTNFYCSEPIIDSCVQKGVQFLAPGVGVVAGNIRFDSPQIVSYAHTGVISTALFGIDFVNANGWTLIAFNNPTIAGWKTYGIRILGSAKFGPCVFNGGTITDIGVSASHGTGIGWQNGVGGVHIQNIDIGVTSDGNQYMDYAIAGDAAINATYSDWVITGNNVRLCAVAPFFLSSGSTFSHSICKSNVGIDDVVGSVASATTIILPTNPIIQVTGTTTITGIVCSMSSGFHGFLLATGGNITVTAGASIGFSGTLTQNRLAPFMWDGTKLWIAY